MQRHHGLLTTSPAYKMVCEAVDVTFSQNYAKGQDYLWSKIIENDVPYWGQLAITNCFNKLLAEKTLARKTTTKKD